MSCGGLRLDKSYNKRICMYVIKHSELNGIIYYAGVFQPVIGMEPFGAFRLLAIPHAVIQALFYSKWTETSSSASRNA